METVKKMEIELCGEVLPKNERSEAILEQRRAAQEALELKREQVSFYDHFFCNGTDR